MLLLQVLAVIQREAETTMLDRVHWRLEHSPPKRAKMISQCKCTGICFQCSAYVAFKNNPAGILDNAMTFPSPFLSAHAHTTLIRGLWYFCSNWPYREATKWRIAGRDTIQRLAITHRGLSPTHFKHWCTLDDCIDPVPCIHSELLHYRAFHTSTTIVTVECLLVRWVAHARTHYEPFVQ